ncbi:HNH endonuclease signature motif containing protein [Gemmobacter serpentinus]|uniref:HNH endonuclease signature motif containing protein n=1 Tax=Gemmobacter serpentinus TaxID=2652247 RepID=UPI00124DC73D|nr:HNH endonuclease signature motif containing protein [Gemmobacter serpentinus]
MSELEAVLANAGARLESCDESFWQCALERRLNLPAPERMRRNMATRPAQQQFRRAVFALKGVACLLSGCSIEDALDAAHVVPHNGDPAWDRPENGLPLRRDLHGLYDGLWWSIDPEISQVRFARRLLPSFPEYYHGIEGRRLTASASQLLLLNHWDRFCASEDASRAAEAQPS